MSVLDPGLLQASSDLLVVDPGHGWIGVLAGSAGTTTWCPCWSGRPAGNPASEWGVRLCRVAVWRLMKVSTAGMRLNAMLAGSPSGSDVRDHYDAWLCP